MNNRQLDLILKHNVYTHDFYRTIVSPDHLEEARILFRPETQNIFVVNTTSSSKTLGHFLLLYFDGDVCIFVDSYGNGPANYSRKIVTFVYHFSTRIDFSNKTLQFKNSCVCGAYVLLFAISLARRYKLATILSWFSTSKKLNDFSVFKYLQKFKSLPAGRLLKCKGL